jgi:ribosomal protein S18 acetylase RimI-like enzyme
MRADLTEVVAPSDLPDGLQLKVYDASMEVALRTAHNAAFLDHPNFTPWSETMWTQWVTESRNFRPELTFVVIDPGRPDEIAAYVQTAEYDAYYEVTGKREAYIGKVGTRREYRGRGLASHLLRHALAAYKEAGYDVSSLDVDSENPTGALGVYERTGFVVESRWSDYSNSVA